MGNALYIDISAFQSTQIDWQQYKQWSEQGDGIARVCLKASEGTGFTDTHYRAYRTSAQTAGIQIIHYHYARPDLNNAQAEAEWFHSVLGTLGSNDEVMLDYEQNTSQATAEWAYEWLTRVEQLTGKIPRLYSYLSFIKSRLQDERLARYPLILAEWTNNPSVRPAYPAPWRSYCAIQYSDKASVPGVPGVVDANVYVGGETMGIPQGWKDDGATLTAPNGHRVVLGFRDYILTHPWDAVNMPLQEEEGRNPLEESTPSLGGGTQQIFNWTTLEWTPSRGVFVAWTGPELLKLRADNAALTAQVAKLQAQLAAQPTPINPDIAVELQVANAAIQKAEEEIK